MDKPLDKTEITLITITCLLILVTAVLIGSILAMYNIRKDCELINAFRINDDVYSCMKEYHPNDYT